MDNKLSELSKPSAYKFDHGVMGPGDFKYGTPQMHSTAKDENASPLYSQEYVSALLSQIEADREIKARLCRESNSLHERLKAAEKRIAELERANQSQDDHINQQQDRIDSLENTNSGLGQRLGAAEKRLATPVRLPELCGDGDNDTEYTEGLNDGITQSAIYLRRQGFKVEGDE